MNLELVDLETTSNSMTHLNLLDEEETTLASSSGYCNNVVDFVEDEHDVVELCYMDEDICSCNL
jgi:hypothetical protein